MSATHAALLHACHQLDQLKKSAQHEDSISGFFSGAIASAFPFCADFVGADSEFETHCYWGQFKKTKAGKENPMTYESESGADFALAFRSMNKKYKVAIFQAKKANGGLDLYRRPPEPDPGTAWRRSQLATLASYGRIILKSLGQDYRTLEDLHWIHYLSYGDGKIEHLQLSKLRPEFTTQLKLDKQGLRGSILVQPNDARFNDFEPLLVRGISSAAGTTRAAGWLTIPDDQLEGILPELAKLTDVYIVDESGGGQESALEKHINSGNVVKRKAASRADLVATPSRPKSRP